MIETLKKQWFVVLIAIIFIGFTVFIIIDTNKDKLPGRSVDGKDVVAGIDGADITADQLYDQMYSLGGGETLTFLRFQASVIDQAIDTTDEIKQMADQYKEYLTQQAQQQAQNAGLTADEFITATIAKNGFHADEIDYYCRVAAKQAKLDENYIKAHEEELFVPMCKENNGRVVSHILVRMQDAKNPTKEEMEIVKNIEKDLETMPFEEVAKKYAASGDGSASQGGYLGYMDKNTQYVDSFKSTALKMKKGEVSTWVKESNESYNGWHLIRVEETDPKAILKDKKAEKSISDAIHQANPQLQSTILKEEVKKADIKYANDDVKKDIEKFLDIK